MNGEVGEVYVNGKVEYTGTVAEAANVIRGMMILRQLRSTGAIGGMVAPVQMARMVEEATDFSIEPEVWETAMKLLVISGEAVKMDGDAYYILQSA